MSALPSSAAQVSVVQAAAALELHRQDEESGQLSSISVRHMTATPTPPPPFPPTNTHKCTHTHTQAKEKYKEWGCAALLIVQKHRHFLSLFVSPAPFLLSPLLSVPFSAHYPPHLHAGCQRAGNYWEGNKIEGLEQW